MVFEICAGIATLVFVILAIYIIITLVHIQRSLMRLTQKIEPLLQNTTDITDSVKVQIKAFNPLCEGINDLGCTFQEKAQSYREEKSKMQSSFADILELAVVSAMLWQHIKKRR